MKTLLTASLALSMLAGTAFAQTAIEGTNGMSQQEILRKKSLEPQSEFNGQSKGDGVYGADGNTTTTLGGQGTGAGAGMGGNQIGTGVDNSATGSTTTDGTTANDSNFNGQSTTNDVVPGSDGDTTNTTGGSGTGGGMNNAQ